MALDHETTAGYSYPARPLTSQPTKAASDPLLEKIAWLTDRSIPIGRWRIGLDGLIGLIPGVGDLAGTAVSLFIIYRAAQAGAPKAVLGKMAGNVAADTIVGGIPVVGDLFDFGYKANTRNLKLFRQALNGETSPRTTWSFYALLGFIALLVLSLLAAALMLVSDALSWLGVL